MTAVPVERFTGCLLGLAVGDALGAPYEGLPAQFVLELFGDADRLIAAAGAEPLRYTDDTQMMIGVAETLAEHGEIVEDALCGAFVANYDPERGYGRGARLIIESMAAGGDWRGVTATVFPGGSLGNGAAMRVAPVGLLFGDDLDRVAEQARLSAAPTHAHPVGVEGAELLALAVALAARSGGAFDRRAFYRELIGRCRSDEFGWELRAAAKLRRRHSLAFLGNSLEADRSVVTAIACFTVAPDSFEEAVGRAICLGDDTDTLAAMTGARGAARPRRRAGPAGREAGGRAEGGRVRPRVGGAVARAVSTRVGTSSPGPTRPGLLFFRCVTLLGQWELHKSHWDRGFMF